MRLLLALVRQLVRSGMRGARDRTEAPVHIVHPLCEGVEFRRYGPRVAAETTVQDGEDAARHEGLLRLADYLFGANHQGEKMAMTAPLGQLPDDGAEHTVTTAVPVARPDRPERVWVIRLHLPAKRAMETLPAPLDGRVHLVQLPAETVAVLRCDSDGYPDSIAAGTARLREALRFTGFEPAGEPTAWFYDPPWGIPVLRLNEISIPVGKCSGGRAPWWNVGLHPAPSGTTW